MPIGPAPTGNTGPVVDQTARDEAKAAQATANQNRQEITAEETQRRSSDDELARRIDGKLDTSGFTGASVKGKLEGLAGDDRLDASAVKGLPAASSGVDQAARDRLDAVEADDWVTSRRMAAESVTEGIIADDAVTGRKIPRSTIESRHYADDSVGTEAIRGEAVGDPELKPEVLQRIDGKLRAGDFTGATVKAKLEGLAGDDRLDASAVKNLPRGGSGVDNVARTDASKALDGVDEVRHDALKNADMRIEPSIVPTVPGLVRNYTLHLDSLVGVPENAAKVIVSAGKGEEGNFALAFDTAWVRTRRTINLTRLTQATYDNATAAGNISGADTSLPVIVAFYAENFDTTSGQDIGSAIAVYRTEIKIGDGRDLPVDYTASEKAKLARYRENPRANGASELAPLQTLGTMRRIAYSSSAIANGIIAPGTFMIGTTGGNQGIFARLSDVDADADAFLESNLRVKVGNVQSVITSFTRGLQGWTARITGDFSGISVGDDVSFEFGPKVPAGGDTDLSDIEDYARKSIRTATIPSDRTLEPLTETGAIPFNFGASLDDPTASGSNPAVTSRSDFGTALSDTDVVTEKNVIADASFTLTQAQATHVGAFVLVDIDVADIATDRFSDVELVLQTVGTGTVVSVVELPHDPTFEREGLQFPLAGLALGGSFIFALKATVRGREQRVTATLSNLRYQRDSNPPLQPFVERVAQKLVDEQADIDGPRLQRIEGELLAGDNTLPPPTNRTGFAAPQWAAAGVTHQKTGRITSLCNPCKGICSTGMDW